MLCKFVDETGRDWDQWLPYLLFAYREVPQASTRFSPFELLYGHEVRGLLTLLKEVWEGDYGKSEPTNIVSFVLKWGTSGENEGIGPNSPDQDPEGPKGIVWTKSACDAAQPGE